VSIAYSRLGEVYQAKDRKLGRDVAIKVLPEGFARDADRAARFQREAKLLASLNHPNIAPSIIGPYSDHPAGPSRLIQGSSAQFCAKIRFFVP
jgi:serine/threonine protein kinase